MSIPHFGAERSTAMEEVHITRTEAGEAFWQCVIESGGEVARGGSGLDSLLPLGAHGLVLRQSLGVGPRRPRC